MQSTIPSEPPDAPAAGTSRARRVWLPGVINGWRNAAREFVVIVAGVLCALGAQAWWESSEEREREREYLRQLLTDTRANERRLQEAIGIDSAAGAALGRLTAALYGGDSLPPADTLVALFRDRAFSSSDLQLLSGTYGALIRAGDLRLIRTDTLRAMIVAYDAMLENTETMLRLFLEQYAQDPAQMARPMPFMRGMFFGPEGSSPPDIDVARLRANPDVEAVLFAVQVSNMNRLQHLRRLLGETARLRDALEAEPGLESAVEKS